MAAAGVDGGSYCNDASVRHVKLPTAYQKHTASECPPTMYTATKVPTAALAAAEPALNQVGAIVLVG
jgi:hypothetical protein